MYRYRERKLGLYIGLFAELYTSCTVDPDDVDSAKP